MAVGRWRWHYLPKITLQHPQQIRYIYLFLIGKSMIRGPMIINHDAWIKYTHVTHIWSVINKEITHISRCLSWIWSRLPKILTVNSNHSSIGNLWLGISVHMSLNKLIFFYHDFVIFKEKTNGTFTCLIRLGLLPFRVTVSLIVIDYFNTSLLIVTRTISLHYMQT